MIFPTKKSKNMQLNVQEANTLWDTLKSNYMAVELMQMWQNFVHDSDFKAIIILLLKEVRENIRLLEALIEKHGIRGPDKNRTPLNSAVNTEALLDENMAQEFFVFAQENVEQLLRALRTATDNDSIRRILVKFTRQAIKRTDSIIAYLKMKGWLETPPLYAQVPAGVNEKMGAGEAFHLFDHLTFRYDNISQTEIYHAFAKDPGFKQILKTGLQESLKKQAAMLEKELTYFGIIMPKKPKNFNMPSDNTELLDDDHMFRMILAGIMGATIFHAQALKQSTVNDRVRRIFKDLLLTEIGYIDVLLKYGKLRGWLNPVPQYRVQ